MTMIQKIDELALQGIQDGECLRFVREAQERLEEEDDAKDQPR